jgi:flagellar export protein FliJ
MAKAFEFRLEKLLGLRRARQDAAGRELAAAQEAVAEAKRSLGALMAEEDRGRRERPTDGAGLQQQAEFLAALERRIAREHAALQERARAELEKRRLLLEARKGVRVLERFRERELAVHRKELDREERKVLDEIAQREASTA